LVRSARKIVLLACFALLVAVSSVCFGQDETANDFTRELAELKQRVEQDESIAAATKSEITTTIQSAEANLNRISEATKRIAEDQQAASTAATRSVAFIEDLKKLQSAELKPPDPATPLTQVENDVTAQQALVQQLEKELQRNKRDNDDRTEWRVKSRTQLEELQKQLDNLQAGIRALVPEDSLAVQAKRIMLLTGEQAAELERNSISARQNRFDVSDNENVLRNERDWLTAKLTQAQAKLAELEKLQTEKRQLAAKQSADAAAKELVKAQSQNPLLVSSYEVNAKLAQRVEEVEARALDAKKRLDLVQEQLKKLQLQSRDTRNRVDTIGLTGSVGAMLRKRRSELPSVRLSLSAADSIKNEMNDIQYEMFDVDQKLDQLSPTLIREEIETANGPQTEAVLASLEEPIKDLVAARKEKLQALKNSLDRLFEKILSDIELNERQLAQQTEEFREYINERILWIRSNDVLFSKLEIDRADATLFDAASWLDAFKRLGQSIVKSPVEFGFFAVLILTLLILKPRFRNHVTSLGQVAARGSCDTFWPTGWAFVLTVVVAITLPLIPLVLYFGIGDTTDDGTLFAALGPALLAVAWFAIPFEILRRICRPKGLANQHFDWSDDAVAKLRYNLGWFVAPAVILVFFITLLRNLDESHRVDLLERSLFVLGMFALTVFAYRTFHPNRGIFSDFLKANQRSWISQTSGLWFGLILALPVSLAGLTILGYYYTAINLAECAFGTFFFAVVVETIRQMLKRLILVQRRHVHIKAARRKHEAQIKARREQQKARLEAKAASADAPKDAAAVESDAPVDSLETFINVEHEIDVDVNAQQAYKLVSLTMVVVWAVGMWMIWTDVLPALKELDNYTLWPNNVVVSQLNPAAAGDTASSPPATTPLPNAAAAPAASSVPVTETPAAATPRITVRNLLVFFVIAVITFISARNLPSAMEMLLLEHLPFDRSLRYAVKSLVSYVIVLVGLILAFRAVSITWSSVQWLATALTFGLAFGMQEIFANFVAGVILMFERPIRIGDWITVDEFTGCVTRIRTRATTIVNWDRKEYVIPNKDLITGRLINWTLSDEINRIVINVGIAYGSDVDKAKTILYEICGNHPKIIDDPPTTVAFDSFGDSSLNIVVRTFIDEIDCRLAVIDQLHTQINSRFNKAGIEISFPQRDLHLRSASPELGNVFRGVAQSEKQNGSPGQVDKVSQDSAN
jgi:potassium efflux system protein